MPTYKAVTAEEAREDRAFHEALGLAAIRRGEVAAVLLAGAMVITVAQLIATGTITVGKKKEG